MKTSTFFKIFGSVFLFPGLAIIIILSVSKVNGSLEMDMFEFLLFSFFLPGIFCLVGAIFLFLGIKKSVKEKEILRKGTKYNGKIFGYTDDASILVNGRPQLALIVRYFDNTNQIQEININTNQLGVNGYPIGKTISFWEYNGKVIGDLKSVRNDILDNEDELMNNIPIERSKQTLISIHCPYCGAVFQAVKGYSNKCPYCGGYINS